MALKLDEIDVRILQQLQLNGRITNVQLSEKVGLSPAPTLERVKKLEHAGLIQSYGALLDAEKLGLGVVVFIEVSLRLHETSDPSGLSRKWRPYQRWWSATTSPAKPTSS
jgi:Lrp/AsnC family leucine-responsive transcriptional regulator